MKTHNSKTYELRNIGHCSYALITLTDLWENAGTISIISDYGNWNFLWGSMGGNIREFLIDTSKSYLMDKFTYDKRVDREWFDQDRTLNRIKNEIIYLRQEEIISAELAREAWDEAIDIHEECYYSAEVYQTVVLERGEALWKVFDLENMPCCSGFSPGLVSFMDEVWPVFVGKIKEEINE